MVRARLPRTTTTAGRSLYEQARIGMKGVVDTIDAFCKELEEEVLPEAMKEALEPTLELAKKYTPVKTGTLRDSGYVEVYKRGGQPEAEIGFSRYGEAPYAIFVHEMPQFYHDPPTRYKYLETAMVEDQDNILSRIAASAKKQTGM